MVAVFGACVGSFINVVAYRLPRACMSIAKPRSRCPRCSAPIHWYDNVPVVSWLLLRGRCRACKAGISFRYPFVELLMAGLFFVVALVVLPREALRTPAAHWGHWVDFGVRCLITAALVALSLIDLDYRILPDQITKSGIFLGPVLAFLAPGVQPTPVIGNWSIAGKSLALWFSNWFGWDLAPSFLALVHGILGAVTGWCVLWSIGWLGSKAFRKPAMGFGDVKMLSAMGAVLGFWCLLAMFLATIAGALVGIAVWLAKKGRYLPFGPFLAFGMWVVMLWGEPVLSAWLKFSRVGR